MARSMRYFALMYIFIATSSGRYVSSSLVCRTLLLRQLKLRYELQIYTQSPPNPTTDSGRKPSFLSHHRELQLRRPPVGGLHQVSWFQFLPHEPDLNPLPDKSVKADQKDAATLLVLSSHLQLQKEGFLSTWTNSFVGPWDPSQGLHNPDEKIKLWLFLPGRYSSVDERAQPAVSRLRVLASGLWLAPGDSEEVATALSQALMICIERRGQPLIEFIFAATEEAIFVHALISAKHIRALSSGDMEMISKHSPSCSGDGLP
ncbi:hypothetical protein RJ640_013233, partial [Escallonia rubra]